MKAITATLPPEHETIEILPLADFHIGDMMSDWELIQRLLKRVAEVPNCYCILGGDLMDTAIASSIGDTYAANLQPMEQLQMCIKLFEPIKDKILCVLSGNHENRVYRTDGLDMTQMMCAQLGIEQRYSSTTAMLFLRCGHDEINRHKDHKLSYRIYVAHGTGGGRKEGGKIQRLVDLSEIVDADLYVCAHTHLPATLKTEFFRCYKSDVQLVTHTFVNTASALRYGGYGDVKGYRPMSRDYPTIILGGRIKGVQVLL